MPSLFAILRPALIGTLGIALSGCISGERHASTPGRRPAMPTVALGPGDSAQAASEGEILAAATRAAGANDIDGVVRALGSVSDPASRTRLASELMRQVSGQDPRLNARLALELASEFDQTGVITGAARTLVQHDPGFALQWSTQLPPGMAGRRMRRAIIDELVRVNPRDALDRIGTLPAGPGRDDMRVLAAGAWARRDPDAAIAWLWELPDDELKPRLTSSVGFEVAQTEPERAIGVAEMLPEGRDRWLLFSAIAQTWVALDPQAVHAWAGGLPAGAPRDAALAGIDTGLGVPSSRQIARAPGLRGRGARTRGGIAAAAAITRPWPEINSPSFEAWLATQAPGMSREEAILEYVRQRGAQEPGAIGPLISTLPGHIRDRAMEIYVDELLLGSPRDAARWVRSLPRSERTDDLMEKTARRYLMINPDAGVEWLEQSTLPLHRKEQLLREAGR